MIGAQGRRVGTGGEWGGSVRETGAIGKVLAGRWRIERLIGRGGMSAVYEASEPDGTAVAIKVPDHLNNPRARARFLREGQVSNLVGHPNAVRVLDRGTDVDGQPFLVMELLDGETLRQRGAAGGGRLDVSEVVWVAEEVLDVLAAAHTKAIVHRDIKPENVFLTRAGQVKVLDFGIAAVRDEALEDEKLTQSGVSLGTPAFMAPEQARGRHGSVDARTDIWSVGATMFFCLTGRHVHHEATTANEALIFSATQRAPALRKACPEVPPEIAYVVDRALELDPGDRWQSAAAMIEALRRARNEGGASIALGDPTDPETTQQDGVSPPGEKVAGSKGARWRIGALLVAGALAGGIAFSLRHVPRMHDVMPTAATPGAPAEPTARAGPAAPASSPSERGGEQPAAVAPETPASQGTALAAPVVAPSASVQSARTTRPSAVAPRPAPTPAAGIPDDVLDRRK